MSVVLSKMRTLEKGLPKFKLSSYPENMKRLETIKNCFPFFILQKQTGITVSISP